jgi:formylglycine-generating enzyme required for sulfatase activity
MASKHALLIGISTYGEGLTPIPSARLDVAALAEVLRDPQLGGFPSEQVVVLQDPQRTPMERAVELLFANRDPEDLLLLYFSGHGFRDDQRQLLLSCSESRKFGEGRERGKVQQSTTLRAAQLREYMKNSSNYQLLILDCCFSGAFAEGMAAKDDGALHLEDFGGEGRAVLTSSASIETSSAPEAGEGLSVYTRFLVEGIRTGAADRQQRGFVDAEDLHLYVSRRVAEAAPAMTPQFFPTRSGHRIRVCRVRLDPTVGYRQQLEKLAAARGGELSAASRVILKEWRAKKLAEGEQISDAQAEQIEAEVLRPWREYAKKKADFAETVAALVAEVDRRQGLSAADWAELRQLKDLWKLKQSDVEETLRRHGLDPTTILLSAEEIDRQLAEVAAQAKDKADAERLAREQEQAERQARDQEAQAHAKAKAEAERLAKEQAQKRKEPELQPLSVSTAVVVQEARQGVRGLLGPKWKLRIEKRTVQVQGYRERLADGVDLTMVQIPAGSFLMGAPSVYLGPSAYEAPQHQVQLQGFFMGQTPITQAQWQVVAGWQKLQRDLNTDPAHFKGIHRPVESVFWEDAIEFCQRLSQRFGRIYTLPSEAQWEYACRAGTTKEFHFGYTLTPDLANYNGTFDYGERPKKRVYRRETTDVASFPANPWGLYDMHGNVWEWCLDQWHANYQGAPADGSAWIDSDVNKHNERLLRGGSWSRYYRDSRSACRNSGRLDLRGNSFGFRVCCLPRGRSSLPLIP